ncbi:enoyl-CoA hydratase [Rugamonas apoptosis]|uniref:Enoyl-CoA hydratase n=1 Tax=Rugamonas apoptosis TaxID=2758570 RepID=A0A7W2ILU3_9BURK|nr:enoyl-CoA hydratase [Rugamonas apoptosis]MBA5688894.1 enoyl-CoA hydratase [Rugamonas apoptosis]
MEEIVSVVENGVLRIGFNRLERKNAITGAMYLELARLVASVNVRADIRALLLHGAEEIFTSGNDLAEFAGDQGRQPDRPSEAFIHAVVALEKPLVAAVNGPAVGIGATVLLHCDLIYAGQNASIQFPFVRLGLCPEFASSLLLPASVGHRRAAELLLLGEPCLAEQAKSWGLVNDVLPPCEVLPRALAAAAKLAAMPPAAVRLTRSLMLEHREQAVDVRIELECLAFAERLKSREAQEAFSAFFERRAPDFSAFN